MLDEEAEILLEGRDLGYSVVLSVLYSLRSRRQPLRGRLVPPTIQKTATTRSISMTPENANERYASTAGIDFNQGAAPDLQLTAVIPVASEPIRPWSIPKHKAFRERWGIAKQSQLDTPVNTPSFVGFRRISLDEPGP